LFFESKCKTSARVFKMENISTGVQIITLGFFSVICSVTVNAYGRCTLVTTRADEMHSRAMNMDVQK